MNQVFPFSLLGEVDLVVDAVYEGGSKGNASDDPIAPLVRVGNQGGFRWLGAVQPFGIRLCVLYSEMSDPDWPDQLQLEVGRFIYYGDNKTPGRSLHGELPVGLRSSATLKPGKRGNLILKEVFDRLHSGRRAEIPPFLIFTKGAKGRDVVFRGLAVPGAQDLSPAEDLVAIWKSKNGSRFQNYIATFTMLNVECVSRAWLEDIRSGKDPSLKAPEVWMVWRHTGTPVPLLAPATLRHRTPEQQMPVPGSLQTELLRRIVDYYEHHPDWKWGFEKCAAALVRMMDSNVVELDLTRFWRDGGRDALGKYSIGLGESLIHVDFALEAKCKQAKYGSGVKETARLIARIRHRQFGIFVTTSYVSEQAYQEIVEDGHPILILAGKDIADLLIQHGIRTTTDLNAWLAALG